MLDDKRAERLDSILRNCAENTGRVNFKRLSNDKILPDQGPLHSISGISWTGRHKIHFDQLKEVGKSALACRFLVENNEKIKARLPLA